VPRIDCPKHGVRQVRVLCAEARSRFTMLMERLIASVCLSRRPKFEAALSES